MIPALIVPVLNRPDLLVKMIASIDYPIGEIVVIDNGGVADGVSARIVRPGHNLGVGAAWNLGMKVTPWAPWWLIVNSDIEFGPGDLERISRTVRPGGAVIYHMLGMAAFALTFETVTQVGFFDENFHPAYNEDLDYQRRAELIGVQRVSVGFTGKHVGSATIHSNPDYRAWNHYTHSCNDRYYEQKWGGSKNGGETFTTPFDKGGSVRDWALDPRIVARQAWPPRENR